MINYKKAKESFDKYIGENFDIKSKKIAHKIMHTYAVVDMAEYIAKDLNLNNEDIELAKIIALLHDIGRFEQVREFNSFHDYETVDHAVLGVKILFDNNFIREFVESDIYDQIIKIAILNHNKYALVENNLTKEEILYSKLIRDADKTDSFRAKSVDDIYTMANITKEDIETAFISDNIYQDFIDEKVIISKERKTSADVWISYIAFVFDYSFTIGLKYIKEKDYINKLVDRFNYKQEDTKTKMEQIRKIALDYINKRLEPNG